MQRPPTSVIPPPKPKLPGVEFVDKVQPEDNYFCFTCMELVNTPLWLLHADDYWPACPKCFRKAQPELPVAAELAHICRIQIPVKGTMGATIDCSSKATVECAICGDMVCSWHFGKIPKTDTKVCKTCADKPPHQHRAESVRPPCQSSNCTMTSTITCVVCGDAMCDNHVSFVNKQMCVYCDHSFN